jgi:hypothetical protein
VHREGGEPVRRRIIDVPAIGLELKSHARCRKRFEELERMSDTEGLSASEHDIGNADRGDLPGERERFLAGQLISPGAIGSGLLAAGKAPTLAAVGELPGDEERRAVVLRGRSEWGTQVKRM